MKAKVYDHWIHSKFIEKFKYHMDDPMFSQDREQMVAEIVQAEGDGLHDMNGRIIQVDDKVVFARGLAQQWNSLRIGKVVKLTPQNVSIEYNYSGSTSSFTTTQLVAPSNVMVL